MRGAYLLATGFLFLNSSPNLIATTLKEQNEAMFKEMQATHQYTPEQMKKVEEIFTKSAYAGQGNPAVTQHPMTTEQCEKAAADHKVSFANPEYEKICKGKFMAPLYDPSKQKPADAKACIDQFEFPDMPCRYPAVWVKAKEAAEICNAQGKRMCDAHEWEGACDGALIDGDYHFEIAKNNSPTAAIPLMRKAHNAASDKNKTWTYGPGGYKKGICAANSTKADNCNGGDWQHCGSNTYPTGSFLECKSKLDVYDLHGNAAEHMNLPLNDAQMASKGSKELGYTEMKGSWFIFDKFQAHPDYCRWRAPFWHGTKVMDDHSHHNYHLSFRCCKDVN